MYTTCFEHCTQTCANVLCPAAGFAGPSCQPMLQVRPSSHAGLAVSGRITPHRSAVGPSLHATGSSSHATTIEGSARVKKKKKKKKKKKTPDLKKKKKRKKKKKKIHSVYRCIY
eukprot:NODE_17711_length_929_cov_3.832918.p2 GENE.NODE_17711_length_929_cov_3.832918~~NODE_17711_length_929_cov_3.832918.p2  ORF type:complete len:114 (+),score=44.67 NODE_17711_length_929_cov_3.832918:537-878(+)